MLKVLIADDEKKVGLLVKKLIEWEKLNLEFLELVQDGQKAYDVIMQKRPDIVITDIRMPSLSGLEMIQKVTEQGIKVHFVVISGYRYFEYAQSALKYGVKDYLLKPIDEIELNHILKKICDEEEQNQNLLEKVETLEQSLENSKHILHRELMERIFLQDEIHETDVFSGDYGRHETEECFRAIGIKIDRDICVECNYEQEQLILRKLTEQINEVMKDVVNDLVISTKNGMWIMVLLNFGRDSRELLQTVLEKLFFQMKTYIHNFKNYEITMGISKETTEFGSVNLILEMAKEAVECRILEGCGNCIESYSQKRNRETKSSDIVAGFIEKIKKSVQIFQDCELEKLVRGCFEEADKLQLMACEYYELGRLLLTSYAKCVTELFEEEMEHQVEQWDETVGHCRTVGMLKKYVRCSLKDHLIILREKQQLLERRPILETIDYVKRNYGQKILLEEIAEKFGFHPNYFSEIFKKETGKNFTQFLLEVRIDASKELLRNTTKTVYEIAEEVGYKDAKYFSQQFTKVVGVKPKEYRKLYY